MAISLVRSISLNVLEVLQEGLEVIPVLLTVGPVDHQQIFLLHKAIEISIVNSPPVFVGDQSVLGTHLTISRASALLVRTCWRNCKCPGTPDDETAHVGNIKKPCTFTSGQMLVHNTSWVKNGHLPAGKIHYLGAQGHMLVVE